MSQTRGSAASYQQPLLADNGTGTNAGYYPIDSDNGANGNPFKQHNDSIDSIPAEFQAEIELTATDEKLNSIAIHDPENGFVKKTVNILGWGSLIMEAGYQGYVYSILMKTFPAIAERLGIKNFPKWAAIIPSSILTAGNATADVTLFDPNVEAKTWCKKLPHGFFKGIYDHLKEGFSSLKGIAFYVIPETGMVVAFPLGAYADVVPLHDWLQEHFGAWKFVPIGVGVILGTSYYVFSQAEDNLKAVRYFFDREQQLSPPQPSFKEWLLEKDAAVALQLVLRVLPATVTRSISFGFLGATAAEQIISPLYATPGALIGFAAATVAYGPGRSAGMVQKLTGSEGNRIDLVTNAELDLAYKIKNQLPLNEQPVSKLEWLKTAALRGVATKDGLWELIPWSAQTLFAGYFAAQTLDWISSLAHYPEVALSLRFATGALGAAVMYYSYHETEVRNELAKNVIDSAKQASGSVLERAVNEKLQSTIDGLKNPAITLPTISQSLGEAILALQSVQLNAKELKSAQDTLKETVAALEATKLKQQHYQVTFDKLESDVKRLMKLAHDATSHPNETYLQQAQRWTRKAISPFDARNQERRQKKYALSKRKYGIAERELNRLSQELEQLKTKKTQLEKEIDVLHKPQLYMTSSQTLLLQDLEKKLIEIQTFITQAIVIDYRATIAQLEEIMLVLRVLAAHWIDEDVKRVAEKQLDLANKRLEIAQAALNNQPDDAELKDALAKAELAAKAALENERNASKAVSKAAHIFAKISSSSTWIARTLQGFTFLEKVVGKRMDPVDRAVFAATTNTISAAPNVQYYAEKIEETTMVHAGRAKKFANWAAGKCGSGKRTATDANLEEGNAKKRCCPKLFSNSNSGEKRPLVTAEHKEQKVLR